VADGEHRLAAVRAVRGREAGDLGRSSRRAAFFVHQPPRSASRVAADGHCWSGKSRANVARLLTCGKVDEARGLPDGVVEGSLGSGGSHDARCRGGDVRRHGRPWSR
jgi:hypothetical protein